MNKGIYLISNSNDPFKNQAMCEEIFRLCPEDYTCMIIYRNKSSVSIGKNMLYNESYGGLCWRRLEGGGLMYHNASFVHISFIAKKEHSSIRTQSAVVSLALKMLEIPCIRLKDNSIMLNKNKLACINNYDTSGDIVRQTLSINLGAMLGSSNIMPETLKDYKINFEALEDALIKSFCALYKSNMRMDEENLDVLRVLKWEQFFKSKQWLYSNSSDRLMKDKFAWGYAFLDMKCNEGIITDMALYSDSKYADLIYSIPNYLVGKPCLIESIKSRILEVPYAYHHLQIIRDIINLIEKYIKTYTLQ